MYLVLTISLAALILTILESVGYIRRGMLMGFVLVTILSCLHYDYGTDYMAYFDLYAKITSWPFDIRSVLAGDVYKEPGWTLLNYLFSSLGGFFSLVAVLSIIQNVCVYRFIKKEVAREWWWLAVFVYLFVSSFYLLSFSMLRQSFVMCLFVGLWGYIKKRNWWMPLIVLLLCSTIHSSAIILLPFAFWGFLSMKKNGKIIAIILVIMLPLLWLSKELLGRIFFQMTSFFSLVGEYEEIYAGGSMVSRVGVGFFLNLIPFAVSVYYVFTSGKRPEASCQLVLLASLGFLFAPFSQLIQLIARVNYYFEMFSIVSIPIIYGAIGNRAIRVGLLAVYILMCCYGYYVFLSSPVYHDSYSVFHTIFDLNK